MLDWEENKDEPVKFDSLDGAWGFTDNVLINKLLTALTRMMRWIIVNKLLYVVFIGVLAIGFGYTAKNKKLAEDMATHATNDNITGMYDVFIKEKKTKVKLTNNHPLYDLGLIKDWENEYGIKFKRIFQYITIEVDGIKEDLLVMKRAARDPESEEREPLKLERSTVLTTSAKNVCESYFAEIPTDYQKKFFDRRRHVRIKSIDDELTYENDNGEKYFRCVIDQASIDDLMGE